MKKKRWVFSYDAKIERKEIQDVKMAIRVKLDQGRVHEVFQKRDRYLLLAQESVPLMNQIASALRLHAKSCHRCSSKQKQASARQARQLVRTILHRDPKNGPALMALVLPFFHRTGDVYVQKVKDVIKKTGEEAYYTYIGHFYKARQDFDKALFFYGKALPRIPYHYGIMYAIAMLFVEMRNERMAKRYAGFALRRYASMGKFYKTDPVTKRCVAELKRIKNKRRDG